MVHLVVEKLIVTPFIVHDEYGDLDEKNVDFVPEKNKCPKQMERGKELVKDGIFFIIKQGGPFQLHIPWR